MSDTSLRTKIGEQIVGEQTTCGATGSPGLAAQIMMRFAVMSIVAVCLLIVPAGTFRFWQGWAVLAAYFVPSVFVFTYFYRVDPALIRRRLRGDESVKTQKLLIRLLKPFFIGALLLPGFDYRWGWSRALGISVAPWLELAALAMILAGFVGVCFVMNTNRYAGRTIRVEEGQKVISTGPYRWVRHPMYTSSLVLWLATPIALGSWVAFPVFALLIPFYIARLLNEEKVLREELPGYVDYCRRTPYRLVPFVW